VQRERGKPRQDGRVGYGARLRFTLILISWFGKLSVGSSPTPVIIHVFFFLAVDVLLRLSFSNGGGTVEYGTKYFNPELANPYIVTIGPSAVLKSSSRASFHDAWEVVQNEHESVSLDGN
jgi:hypothetical protein